MSNYSDLCNEIQEEFSDFTMRYKDDSFLMKVLNVVLFVLSFGRQNKFMTSFITTVGNTVYLPRGWFSMRETDRLIVLRHERVHMRQRRKYTSLPFAFLYLFFPFPFVFAYFRAKFEKEAYEESMKAAYEYYGVGIFSRPVYKENIIGHFTSGEYLWMWPFRKSIEAWYDETVKNIIIHATVSQFR